MGSSSQPCVASSHRKGQFTDNMGSKNGKPVLRPEDVTALSNSSGMDEGQIKQAFESFVTEHPDGRMKPKDFREMMQVALPGKDALKMEKHVFRVYDANNDGFIDFNSSVPVWWCIRSTVYA